MEKFPDPMVYLKELALPGCPGQPVQLRVYDVGSMNPEDPLPWRKKPWTKAFYKRRYKGRSYRIDSAGIQRSTGFVKFFCESMAMVNGVFGGQLEPPTHFRVSMDQGKALMLAAMVAAEPHRRREDLIDRAYEQAQNYGGPRGWFQRCYAANDPVGSVSQLTELEWDHHKSRIVGLAEDLHLAGQHAAAAVYLDAARPFQKEIRESVSAGRAIDRDKVLDALGQLLQPRTAAPGGRKRAAAGN